MRTATVFRIDLRWYMWDATVWNRILQDYPYGILDDGVTSPGHLRIHRIEGAGHPWRLVRRHRVATAALSGHPAIARQPRGTGTATPRRCRLNIAQERVMRVAFNGSGISKNNRVLERHDAVHGYYWRTYDFEEVPQNLARPRTASARSP